MKTGVTKEYPLEVFPNWNILSREPYYVAAPVEKLGDWAFHLRTHMTSLILAGNPAIAFLQHFSSTKVTKVALLFSWFGLEEFFVSLIVALTWLVDKRLGFLLSLLLACGFFLSGSLKVSLCLPRPPAPPAKRLSEENRDWAWPSNHALMATAFPWFIWIYSSNHYDLPLWGSLLLLSAICTWNFGVSWARCYLGVHSPCDVLAGWTIGVLLLFIYSGFSDRLFDYYLASSVDNVQFFACLYGVMLFLLFVHPRSWPETQSYGEVVSVLPAAAAIWCSRVFNLAGTIPFKSLRETTPDSPIYLFFARFFVGVAAIVVMRVVVKTIAKVVMTAFYDLLDLEYYSYSAMCKSLGDLQPTKRFTPRMRFKPITGQKVISFEDAPYDIDLPIKFMTYSFIGFMVGEGCPWLFQQLGI